MAIWKITDTGPIKVEETKFQKEGILEEKLEDWVVQIPEVLDEPLLIIGRQVMIPEIRDRLDILALDTQGNAVVIELKRGKLKDPVDIQGLRYASYISKWGFQDLEQQAKRYLDKVTDPNFNFNEMFETFCSDAGVDDVPDINSDQRIIIVGAEVKEKLGSVTLWLREHNVDIKVVEIDVYREGDSLFVQPQVIIPVPISRFDKIGQPPRSGEGRQLWVADGKTWHLDKRCSQQTREMVLQIDDIIKDNFEVDGPRWNQKFYIAYRVGNYNWLMISTHPKMLLLAILVKAGSFDQAELAAHLGVEQFDADQPLSEKFALPSSVLVKNRNENFDRIYLRVKDDFSLGGDGFLTFLEQAYSAFPR